MPTPTIEDAILLAANAHRHMTDKSGQPYILHPLRVMFKCKGETARIVAILHDVVEDTSVTFDDLRHYGYSEEIITALSCVTLKLGETYADFIERAASSPIATEVKLADLEDNMDVRRLKGFHPRDMERMKKYLYAWQRLGGKDV